MQDERPSTSRATVRIQAEKAEGRKAKQPDSSPSNTATDEKQPGERRRSALKEARGVCYTTGEAIEKLNMPRHVFHYMVKKGEIPKGVRIPLRKQVLYRKADIDKLVEKRARYPGGLT